MIFLLSVSVWVIKLKVWKGDTMNFFGKTYLTFWVYAKYIMWLEKKNLLQYKLNCNWDILFGGFNVRVVLVVNQNKVLRFVSQVSSNTLEIKDSKIIWPGKKTTKPSGINISTELKVNIRIKQLVREKKERKKEKSFI